MSRDKQIEEMAKIICAPTANKGNCDKCGFKRHCSKFDDATDLYNAGYRKASDLAEEIFAEIEATSSYSVDECNGRQIYSTKIYTISALKLAELKKKYTEGGE